MKFYYSAKRALLFISLCCLSAPAIAACSDEELLEYTRVDDALMEYKESFKKTKPALDKAAKSNSREDLAKYCQIERQNNQLSLEWISIDDKIKKACPVFYSKSKGGNEGSLANKDVQEKYMPVVFDNTDRVMGYGSKFYEQTLDDLGTGQF